MSSTSSGAKRPLPPQILRFIAAYAGDATAAALSAGYARRSARQQGHRLLQRPDVIEALRERRQQLQQAEAQSLERVALSAERTLQTMADLAYFDPRDMVREDGSPKSINEMGRAARMAVAGFEVVETWAGSGENRRLVSTTWKYRLQSRLAALDQAARVLGLYAKDNEQRRSTREMTDEELLARAMTLMGMRAPGDPPTYQ